MKLETRIVKVKKITDNPSNFKTTLDQTFTLFGEPEIGHALILQGNAKGGIITSEIKRVGSLEENGRLSHYLVTTKNSTYRLDIVYGNN